MSNSVLSFQTSCSHLTVFDILMCFVQHWNKTATPFLKPIALSGLLKTYKRRGHQEQRKYIRCLWRQNSGEGLLTFFFVWISFCNFLLTLLLSVFLVSLISTVWRSFQARAFSANFSPFDCTHIQINLNYCYFFLFKKGYAWPVWTKFEPAAHRLLILLTVCI